MLVDCDHIGWNSSKINSQLVSAWRSLSADPNIMDLLQGEQPEIWAQSDPPPVDLSVGDILSQIAAEWLQIAQRSQWRAYRKPPLLFWMVPSLTPYNPTPQMGSHMPPWYANGHISTTSDPIHFTFGTRIGFSSCSGSADRMVLFRVISNPRWRPATVLENFECYPLCYPLHVKILWYGFQGTHII